MATTFTGHRRYQRAVELTHLLARTARGKVKPTSAFRQIPVLANLTAQYTVAHAMPDWVALSAAEDGGAGRCARGHRRSGSPLADMPDTGMSPAS